MEILRDSNVNGVRMIACLPSLLVWTLAALSASRWLASIGQRLVFNDSTAARVMPFLWLVIMLGLPMAGYGIPHRAGLSTCHRSHAA